MFAQHGRVEVSTGLSPVRASARCTQTPHFNHTWRKSIDQQRRQSPGQPCDTGDLHQDNSLGVIDVALLMDIRSVPGVELNPYQAACSVNLLQQNQFSGGLHGVGISGD